MRLHATKRRDDDGTLRESVQFIPFIPSAEKGSPESGAELDHLRKGVQVASVFPGKPVTHLRERVASGATA